MQDPRSAATESLVLALAKRTARLSEMIDRATSSSPAKEVRETGAQLVELLGERMEELRELHAMEDDDIADRLRAHAARLALAEQKVNTWPQVKASRVKAGPPPRRGPRARPVKTAA